MSVCRVWGTIKPFCGKLWLCAAMVTTAIFSDTLTLLTMFQLDE